MPRNIWTPEKIKFIKDNIRLSDQELADHFNVTKIALKCIRQKYRILRDVRKATPHEHEMIRKHYPDCDTKWLAKKLNRPLSFLHHQAARIGIQKSEKFYDSPFANRLKKGTKIGPDNRYKKGRVSENKGIKMSEETKKKCQHTFFQKGHKPHNTKSDGEITIRHDHSERGERPYQYIRISEGNWKELHRHLWEQENGPIQKGFNVVFKDGNTMNCVLTNLEIISDRELADRNRDSQYPEDLRITIRLNNKLKKEIYERR